MYQTQIDLRVAKIPYIGKIAVHYWWVIIDGDNPPERWEIWQRKALVKSSWGYLHKNLMPITSGVGNGDSWCEAQWQGEEAKTLMEIIRETPVIYPYNNCYRYYPGPNSNTYIQWILDQGNINYQLSPKGLGKYYHRHYS